MLFLLPQRNGYVHDKKVYSCRFSVLIIPKINEEVIPAKAGGNSKDEGI